MTKNLVICVKQSSQKKQQTMEDMEKDFFGAPKGSALCGKKEVNERLYLSNSVHKTLQQHLLCF